MAESSSNLPVTTFIALGTLAGLFIVFNSWRTPSDAPAQEAPERIDNPTAAYPPGVRRSERNDTRGHGTGSEPQEPPSQLWEQTMPGVYCLNAACTSQRVSPGVEPPCASPGCPSDHGGMICIDGDCRGYAELQRNVDFVPATRRISRRIKEAMSNEGIPPSQPVVVELMMDNVGVLSRVSIAQSSGSVDYDREVRRAALYASPFSELRGLQPHTRSLMQLIHIKIEP